MPVGIIFLYVVWAAIAIFAIVMGSIGFRGR